MRIAIYHPARIPPTGYGGTERVIDSLARGLLALGHRVTLVADPRSQVPGAQLISSAQVREEDLDSVLPPKTDLVHFSATPRHLPKKPFLITIHGNGKVGEKFHANTVFVSKKHAENHGSTYFVHNGLDFGEIKNRAYFGTSVAFLAKASWKVKNLRGAMEVSRKAKLDLHIMGNREWPWDGSWLARSLSRRGLFRHGMVGEAKKVEVLNQAKALLFPVRWHEPFGLAVLEALAHGCPVFATPYGSLPELVTPEVGFLSASSDDWVQALAEKTFSPEACQKRVRENFTHLHMTRNYLRLYEEILANGTLNQKSENLYWRPPHPAETLLPWN